MDPEMKQMRIDDRVPTFHHVEEEIFILSLHTEAPSRPNASYTRHHDDYGTIVSPHLLAGGLKKDSTTPVDFKAELGP
jgi:hypothetical protein